MTANDETAHDGLWALIDAGIIVSQVFFEKNMLDVLPGIWMLFYGCGALAMSFFTP